MSMEAMKCGEPNTEEDNMRLNRDVMEMISTLTCQLAGSSHVGDEDEHGVSIITLAGKNSGATLKNLATSLQEVDVAPLDWATLVNSNLQAINNTVMLRTKYKSHDPGVHVDISEDLEPGDHNYKRGRWRGKREDTSSASESDSNSSEADDL